MQQLFIKSLVFTSLLIACIATPKVFAEDIQVTRFDDHDDGRCDSDCSLREAISYANHRPGLDRIHLTAGVYTIDIPPDQNGEYDDPFMEEDMNVNGDFDITDQTVILGDSQGKTSISSNVRDRVFEVISGTTVFHSLTIQNGKAYNFGAGVENHATSIFYYCTLTNNRASSSFSGGNGAGLANFDTAKMYFSTITNNYAFAGEGTLGKGGGIYNVGELVIRDSTVQFNQTGDDDDASTGGGLYNGGYADIRRSLFRGNIAYRGGSAIMVDENAYLKLVSSTVTENSSLWLPGAALRNNKGTLLATHVTIANNFDFGIFANGTTYLNNSILVKNQYQDYDDSTVNCQLFSGPFYSNGNLMGDSEFNCPAEFRIADSDTFNQLLVPLADNGGWTPTFALQTNSLAIDNATAPCPAFDQRALPTAIDGNNDGVIACDIGAFELQ
ncbi:hypothetical protein TDB9533_03438 [Thalassocella blandensis]|nr:hypothetical protein TDB9533_03438 [Thalassocella blandensis]